MTSWPRTKERGGSRTLTINAAACQAAASGGSLTLTTTLPSTARYVGCIFGEDHTPFDAPGDVVTIVGEAELDALSTGTIDVMGAVVLTELSAPPLFGESVGGLVYSLTVSIDVDTYPVASGTEPFNGGMFGVAGTLDGTSFTFTYAGEAPLVVYANGSAVGPAPADEAEFLANLNAQLAPFATATGGATLVITGDAAGEGEDFTLADSGNLLINFEVPDGTFEGTSGPGDVNDITAGAVSATVVYV